MKQLTFIAAIGLIILLTVVIYTSCQNVDVPKPSNSLVGTWKAVEIIADGEKVNFSEEYLHCTEGGFWSFQCKWSNPYDSNREPESLEEYKAIIDNYQAAFGTYQTNGDSVVLIGKVDLKPQFTNNHVNAIYKISADTLNFDVGSWHYKFVRQL
jgi:hypothetical protein